MPQTGRARNARPKIERAAISLFITEGIDAATTRQIAEKAGVSEGALYRHYKSKEELSEALFNNVHDKLSSLLAEAALTGNDLESRIRSIVDAYCRMADEDWEATCYHLLNLNRFLKTDIRRDDDPVSLAEMLVKNLIAQNHIPAGNAALLTAMSFGIVSQTALNLAYNRLTGPLSQYADDMSTGILAVLKTR